MEVALARTAAVPAISDAAGVMVLGKQGYTTRESLGYSGRHRGYQDPVPVE